MQMTGTTGRSDKNNRHETDYMESSGHDSMQFLSSSVEYAAAHRT